jgi:hypothetical protein
MKAANPWITYRTRFLVQAKQLTTSLTFMDALGRQHSGSKGDYLVESSDGVLSIAPRQIFEDIYVPLTADQNHRPETSSTSPLFLPSRHREALQAPQNGKATTAILSLPASEARRRMPYA